MAGINYPRTSGGEFTERELRRIAEECAKIDGASREGERQRRQNYQAGELTCKHDALKQMIAFKISSQEVSRIIRSTTGHPGVHKGTTVYYDGRYSVVLSPKGLVLGIYKGRINHRGFNWRQEAANKKTKAQQQAQVKEHKPEEKPPKKKFILGNSPRKSNAPYATAKSQRLQAKTSAGIANLESAVDLKKQIGEAFKDFLNPYMPGTQVEMVILEEDQVFVRLYSKKIESSWVMLKEDYEKYSWEKLCVRYSIPPQNAPDKICEIFLKKGTKMRRGVANKDEKNGLSGGGLQYQIIREQFKAEEFPPDTFMPL